MDEADKLLNMDFEKPLNKILEVLPKKKTDLFIQCHYDKQSS